MALFEIQRLEPIQMPIIRRLAESAVVHSHSGIFSGCNRNVEGHCNGVISRCIAK